MNEEEFAPVSLPLSKRAARRLIQRAFVLAGRNRQLRQHIREARLTSLWILEDWRFEWTVALEKGRIEFDRRPTKNPDATLTWPTAEEFFNQARSGSRGGTALATVEDPNLRRVLETVMRFFFNSLREVLENPVDEEGTRLD